ncbi:MAG: hypothetical protein OEW48_19040 [Phycisphaerae bacterium]|nr:hypothetical protein [Phycisphaerae bacterium]
MIRIFQIAFLTSLALLLTGCRSPAEEPIWERVKITDLVSSDGSEQVNRQRLETINFNVYIYEIPSDNIGTLEEIWPMVYAQPLQFNNFESFSANSFLAGFGQIPMWSRIADLLRSADGVQVGTVSLLLPDGRSNDVAVAILDKEQAIFYFSEKRSMIKAKFEPGQFGLRIQAEKIAGSRGVCAVSVLPVFSPLKRGSLPLLSRQEKPGDILFTATGFSLKMSPGDFVLVGPEKYNNSLTTLGGLFFSKPAGSLFFSELERKMPEHKPALRLFLLVCTGIN